MMTINQILKLLQSNKELDSTYNLGTEKPEIDWNDSTEEQRDQYFEAINDASHNNLYEFGVATLILRFINNQ